jgi:hypothetical protein
LRLQRLVIGRDTRYLHMGWRTHGGFVGSRDRETNAPLTVSWRIFWMTMINRAEPKAPPARVLTKTEIRLLDGAVRSPSGKSKTLSDYLTKLARLGGYLARAGDQPPGNTVIWRGLSRLRDIEIGAKIVEGYG